MERNPLPAPQQTHTQERHILRGCSVSTSGNSRLGGVVAVGSGTQRLPPGPLKEAVSPKPHWSPILIPPFMPSEAPQEIPVFSWAAFLQCGSQ